MIATAWQQMLAAWPYSERALYTAGTTLTLELSFLFWGCLYEACDRFGWCRSWRVHESSSGPGADVSRSRPPPALLREAAIDHAVNGLLLRPVFVWMVYPLFRWAGMATSVAALPSAASALAQLLAFMVIDDAWFYWAHRLLHTPWLYRHVHKRHHRFRFTHPLASEFAHPAEDLLSNTVATVLGPLLLGSHMALVWLYGYIKLSQTVEAHSGYVVPFPFSVWSLRAALGGEQGRHEFHHSRNVGNFGGFFDWWDRAMGTDAAYEAWRAAGSPPLKELRPRAGDDGAKKKAE